jgi:predicted ArsR family transcriptional regulator
MAKLLPSDAAVADLLHERGEMTISALAEQLDVTATAVRQRLNRLMEAGHVDRKAVNSGRGRPSHRYSLTELGRREAGGNFADLAVALWEEVRSITDAETRRGLLERIAARMAKAYSCQSQGKTAEEKMKSVASLFGERRVPFSVETSSDLPVLTAKCCPYPSLAERDRSICTMEKLLFSEMVGQKLRLSDCRLDGDTCCTFEISVG